MYFFVKSWHISVQSWPFFRIFYCLKPSSYLLRTRSKLSKGIYSIFPKMKGMVCRHGRRSATSV